ncbi:MAG: TolC family protein [Bacteroidales bacterium]|nr:TolC family protein [Bacteroidales bacterium]
MKKLFALLILSGITYSGFAQITYSLDSCRNMALSNNKELKIADEKINAATYEKKSAVANFLPGIDASASYLYNSKDLRLISDKQLAGIGDALNTTGQALGKLLQEIDPTLLPLLEGLGNLPGKLKDATTFDIKNMYVGMVTATQPIFMGGKIVAYHKITQYAENLAKSMRNSAVKDVIINVDQSYWQVVSLVYKKQMAESYLELLKKLSKDVDDMYAVGVATKSDQLTVAVKLNEAEIAMTKVTDGLVLSKMLLAQICGLPIHEYYSLADEKIPPTVVDVNTEINMNDVYSHRDEIKSLELATQIYKKKEIVERSAMLPSVALMGNYLISNPNMLNGFEKKFSGMFSVGVGVSIPVWHWGKNYNKLQAAKAETRAAQYKLEDAKELIELQVNQAKFKVNEANKTLLMTITNMNKAEENLQNAQIGYKEGVLTAQNVLEAQTAWLKAQSEKIDAEIGIKLSEIYFYKSIGKKF